MMKIGFVGTGGFTKHHMAILEEIKDVQVIGFVGSSEEKAIAFAENYPGTKGYADLEQMLEKEQIDAVYICVPPMAHQNYEDLLIEYQIPFFVEKPLGIDEAKVRYVKEQVEKRNALTSVGYHFRYADTVKKLQEKLKEVHTGLVHGNWMGSMPGAAWWGDQAQSGGQFNEQTTHIVDLIRFLFGEVKSVYAQEVNVRTKKQNPKVTVADVGVFILTMENGLKVQINNTSVLPNGVGEVGISIYTDEGILKWNPDHLHMQTATTEEIISIEKDPYLEETEAFLHAIKTGDRSRILSTYQDAWKSFKIAICARQSVEEKREVHVSEIKD